MSTITSTRPMTSPTGPAAPLLEDVYRMDIDEFERIADFLKAERVELIDGLIVERRIVNLIDRQVEVYTGPGSDSYSACAIFKSGQVLPVMIDGVEVGQIAVAEILPRIVPAAESNGA